MKQIIIERRPADYMAFMKGRREVFGCGSSQAAAIGDMIVAHRRIFNIEIDSENDHLNELNQSEKPLYEQAAEVRAHIAERDYGLAEKKATIMCESLRKGDWTLGDLE